MKIIYGLRNFSVHVYSENEWEMQFSGIDFTEFGVLWIKNKVTNEFIYFNSGYWNEDRRVVVRQLKFDLTEMIREHKKLIHEFERKIHEFESKLKDVDKELGV